MADINPTPIQGPIGPQNQPPSQDSVNAGPEKFQEEYRKRQVKKADSEAKKEQKQQEEEEEEEIVAQSAGQQQQGPPQNLETSPFEVQSVSSKKEAPTSQPPSPPTKSLGSTYTPTASSEPSVSLGGEAMEQLPPPPPGYGQAQPPPAVPAAPAPTPSISEPFVPSYPTEEETYPQMPSSAQPAAPTTPTTPPTTGTQTPSSTETQPTGVPSTEKTKGKTAAKRGKVVPTKVGEKAPPAIVTAKPKVEEPTTDLKAPPSAPMPPPAAPVKEQAKQPEEVSIGWEGNIPPPSALSSGGTGQDKGEGEKKEKEPSALPSGMGTEPIVPFGGPAPTLETQLPVYTTFNPVILDMFDRMIGSLTVLQESSGERKTTILLNNPKMEGSAFYGAEVIIEEDLSLAPGQYNIKLIGSPEAVNLFQANSESLLAAFNAGPYNFKVQRLETIIRTEEKRLIPKVKGGGEQGSETEQGNT